MHRLGGDEPPLEIAMDDAGRLWGAGAFLFFPSGSPLHQVVFAFVLTVILAVMLARIYVQLSGRASVGAISGT